jgi:hypothetical protein
MAKIKQNKVKPSCGLVVVGELVVVVPSGVVGISELLS